MSDVEAMVKAPTQAPAGESSAASTGVQRPFLSVVTPTRGNFSDAWLDRLLAIEGDDVEFVLVYHPFASVRDIGDRRVRSIVAPFKGELMQRMTGLLSAKGEYSIALDDDDFMHSQIVPMVRQYFQRFPDSWMMRLMVEKIDRDDVEALLAPWGEVVDVENLGVCQKRRTKEQDLTHLLEVPIAPLDKPFDPRIVLLPGLFKRTDDCGVHLENFNNKVWRTDFIRPAMARICSATKLFGIVTLVPNMGADRLMGLAVQAMAYERGRTIGHWMPSKPPQIRFADLNPALKPPRHLVLCDLLLVKAFPQYGYFWNLFFAKLYDVPRAFGKALKWKLFGKPEGA